MLVGAYIRSIPGKGVLGRACSTFFRLSGWRKLSNKYRAILCLLRRKSTSMNAGAATYSHWASVRKGLQHLTNADPYVA